MQHPKSFLIPRQLQIHGSGRLQTDKIRELQIQGSQRASDQSQFPVATPLQKGIKRRGRAADLRRKLPFAEIPPAEALLYCAAEGVLHVLDVHGKRAVPGRLLVQSGQPAVLAHGGS